MSGDEINRSLTIVVLPLILLFSIVVIIFVLTTVDFSQFAPFDASGIASGMSTALPFVGAGLIIGLLITIHAFIGRRR